MDMAILALARSAKFLVPPAIHIVMHARKGKLRRGMALLLLLLLLRRRRLLLPG